MGRDKTLSKICSRFYWKGMCDDIKEYIKQCDKCQRMNCKFQKSNAELHSVPVKPQVWSQVSFSFICLPFNFSIIIVFIIGRG